VIFVKIGDLLTNKLLVIASERIAKVGEYGTKFSPRPTSSLFNLFIIKIKNSKMSFQDNSDSHHEGNESDLNNPGQSVWKRAWLNNKGIFLIILAQAVGSSMDAIVRFLQQGEHGMHPFQV